MSSNEMFFDWTPQNPTTPSYTYQPTTTALARVPKIELPSMAEVLKRQFGTSNQVVDLGYNYTDLSPKALPQPATPPTITNPTRLLGYTPTRTVNTFSINGKYFILENGKTIGCFDKFDKADWVNELRKLRQSGVKVVQGEPVISNTTSAGNLPALRSNSAMQQVPAQAQEPKTWEGYAKEHGTTYQKPTNGVQAAEQIAEKRIQLNKLEKEIETLKQHAKSNPNANGVLIADKIAAKRIEANALENEIAQIKAGLQTPKVDSQKAAKKTSAMQQAHTPAKGSFKAPEVETPVVKQELPRQLGDGFEAIVEDPAPVQETATGTKAEPAPREVVATPEEVPVEGTPADKKVKPTGQEKLKAAKNSSKLKGLKKIGKWGAIAALAVGAGALLLKACSKDEKPAAPVQDENTQPAQNPAPAETVPEEQAPAQETPAQETPAAPQEPENAEIAAVKGDDYWKYARMELIAEHQGEVDYKPTDTEIYGRMKEIMERADIGMAEDNVHPNPMLNVNDKVELDAETAKLRNEAINQLKEEHKDQEGYEPTYNEVARKFEELAAGKTEKAAA